MKKKSQAGCESKPEEGIQEGEGKEQEQKKEYRRVNKAGKSVDM